MAEGYIQGASVYEVVSVLSTAKPEQNYQWAWQSAIEVSCALIATDHIKLAPSPSGQGIASGLYANLLTGLAGVVARNRPADSLKEAARRKTNRWARENMTSIRQMHQDLKRDQENFDKWLSWNTLGVWTEHAQRMEGLVDPQFIPRIAAILELPKYDLERICRLTRDPQKVADYARRQDAEEVVILKDAFVLSALIRGRYYDYIAKESGWQILHHPIRQAVLPSVKRTQTEEFCLSNTAQYFSNVMLAAAFAESNPTRRVTMWAENVCKARLALLRQAIELPLKYSDDAAVDAAVDAAKEAGIVTYSPRMSTMLDEVLSATVAVGIGALTSFYLTGWDSLATGILTHAISRQITRSKNFGEHVLSAVHSHHIRDLAIAGPGRIGRSWEDTSPEMVT